MRTLPLRSPGPAVRVLLLLALLSAQARADLRVQADRRSLEEGETLELRIQVDARAEDPDLTDLAPVFDVLHRRKSSQFRSVNGRSTVTTQWRLTLLPRRSGTLEIPPIRIAGETSAPITVEVRPVSGRTRRLIDRTVYFDNEVDRERVHVQEQIVYTVRLFYAEGVQLYMDLPATPELPHAIVQSLGEVRAYKERIDGTPYDVIEQRYAVFPQRSGTLRVPELSVTGGVRLPRSSGRPTQRTITISSEPLELTVDPRPERWPEDADWLPASRVELVDRVPDGPARAGEPLERTLLLVVDGQPANLLPPIEARVSDQAPPGADGVRVYPERPITADDFIASGIRGSRAEVSTLIPGTVSDVLVLPEVRLPWWNTEADRMETAVLPERRIPVRGSGAMAVAPPVEGAADGAKADAGAAPVPPGEDAAPAPDAPPEGDRWWLLPLLAAVVGAGVWMWHEVRRRRAASGVPGGGTVRAPAAALREACREGDAAGAEAALGPWLDERGLPRLDAPLARACERIGAPAPEPVRRLRAARYGPSDAAPGAWAGDELVAWAGAVDRVLSARRRRRARSRSALPPLYAPGQG